MLASLPIPLYMSGRAALLFSAASTDLDTDADPVHLCANLIRCINNNVHSAVAPGVPRRADSNILERQRW